MSAQIIRPGALASSGYEDDEDGSPLFDDVATLTDHELRLTIGAVKPPRIQWRHSHPLLDPFPSIEGEAFERLVDDIRRNGQQKAIAMFQGLVWDGRARYDACRRLGLVPRLWVLRVKDPIVYLLQRHDRFGAPRSPERQRALRLLARIDTPEWKRSAKIRRAEWIADSRDEFRQLYKQPEPCAVCGLGRDYSHAHHSFPLSVQYELGLGHTNHTHDWLCPVHHKGIHRLWASKMTPTERNEDATYRPDVKEVATVFERGWQLFVDAGGITEVGNWGMVRP